MKFGGRTFFTFWILVVPVLAISTQIRAQAQAAGGAATQSATDDANSAAARAAARKKRFEEIKRRLELGEDAENLDAGDDGGGIMRIVSITPHVNTDASNRHTTESLQIVYELETQLSEGSIEVVSAGRVTAQYGLPSLKAGRHTMTIPKGMPLANDPYTFTCNLEGSRYSGVTLMVDSLWDNRDRDSSNTEFPREEDESIYDYTPEPPPEDRDEPSDAAAAFRGDEIGITSFNIPAKRNRARRSVGKPMEIQILGVGFAEGSAVECSKQMGNQPKIEAGTRVHDVRIVSTLSHDMNNQIPVLKAGRFNVPEEIAAHGTYLRIVGKAK